jgi:hypothetical protein
MDGIKMDSRQKWKRSKRMNKEMGSNSNNNKDSSEAHRVLVLQVVEHLVRMRQEYMMYCISGSKRTKTLQIL